MKPNVFLIFGEDHYDCLSVREFADSFKTIEALVRAQRTPQVFIDAKTAKEKNFSNAERIVRTVEAAKVRYNVRAVIVHKDCDDFEPAHRNLRRILRNELENEGIENSVPAVPAWETEAWLMLFPAAFEAYRPCWKKLNLGGRSVGMVPNAKEFLRRSLRSKSKGCRDYRESDACEIARKA